MMTCGLGKAGNRSSRRHTWEREIPMTQGSPARGSVACRGHLKTFLIATAGGCCWHLWVEARNAAEEAAGLRTAPTTKSYLAPNVNSVEGWGSRERQSGSQEGNVKTDHRELRKSEFYFQCVRL